MRNFYHKHLCRFTLIAVWVLAAVVILSSAALAQTTVFNFQGRLNDGANPANGNFELQFKLYNALSGGTQIGAVVTRPSVAVINGVFSTQLDFGATAFDGSARYIEIGVRPAGNTSPFTILAPRQPILSTPYSLRALKATTADTATNALQLGGIAASEYVTTSNIGNSFIKNATTQQTGNFNINGSGIIGGNLGVGTIAPTTKLQVQASGYGITQTDGTVTVGSFVSPIAGWLGTKSNHPLFFFTNDSQQQMILDTAGNLGIGTAPSDGYKLDVNGNARMAIANRTITFGSPNGETGMSIVGTNRADIRFEDSTLKLLAGPGGVGPPPSTNGIAINISGSVGIGTTAPRATLDVAGNAVQNLNGNGLVKAMIYVNQNGTINRCYNSQTNSSTGNCGFTVALPATGFYDINFGFQVDNRFITTTPLNNINTGGCLGGEATIEDPTGNLVRIETFCATRANKPFMIFVY